MCVAVSHNKHTRVIVKTVSIAAFVPVHNLYGTPFVLNMP